MDTLKSVLVFIFKLIVIVGILFYIYTSYHQQKILEEKLDNAQQLTSQQVQDIEYLRNQLDMKQEDAKDTVTIIKEAQTNQIPPQTSITIQAPSPQEAATIVTEKIQEKDPTLPPEALEDTDKTIVAEQPQNEEYQVGVYKIDLQKDWSIGTGIGINDDEVYVPLSVSRQYEKDRAIDIQINLDPDKNLEPNGVQVMHRWYF